MLTVTNKAEFKFVWPEGGPYVEVYHPDASYPDAPIEVVVVKDLPRSEASLNVIAHSSSEYARF